MKILRLSASNVMRLKAVEIEPNGTVQIIAGKNGAGKTSLLNALYLALAGGAASRDIAKPVRAGEEWAEVKLDLGTIVVTRTWDETGKTTLTVKAADGATYKSPQTLLDSLLGALTFDPLEFTRQRPSVQRQSLLDLLGLDFTLADKERARLYDERLDIGRQAHAFGDLPKLEKGAPMTEVSAAVILDRINASTDATREIQHAEDVAAECDRQVASIDRRISEAEAALKKLRAERVEVVRRGACAREDANTLPAGEYLAALRAELHGVEDRNKVARDNQRIAAGREQQKACEQQYAELGQQIKAIDDTKAAALAAAAMPVDGLGFDDQGVTFGNVPFGQASSAEQIRVSFAMAISMNPTLRLVLIPDGSLLDSDSMAALRAAADQHDVQVFIEMVGDGGDDPTAIVISDGEVVQR